MVTVATLTNTSKLSRATPGRETLRTAPPLKLLKEIGAQAGDVLFWQIIEHKGKKWMAARKVEP